MNETRLAQQRREDALDEVLLFVDLAINRSRASRFSEPRLKALIRGTLEAAKQELLHLRNDANQASELPQDYPQYDIHPEVRNTEEKEETSPLRRKEAMQEKREQRLVGTAE